MPVGHSRSIHINVLSDLLPPSDRWTHSRSQPLTAAHSRQALQASPHLVLLEDAFFEQDSN